MNTEQERCVKCDYCDLEDFFWDGKRLCFIYRYPRKNGKQNLDKAIQCIKMLRDHLYGKEDKE